MKRAQAEALGILVVVILLLLALTVVLVFYIKSGSNEEPRRVQNLANNLANTFAGTTLCEGVDVAEAFDSCSLEGEVCGVNSCDALSGVLDELFLSIDTKYGYRVTVSDGEEVFFSRARGSCAEIISSQDYPTPSGHVLRVSLCP